MSSPNVQFLIFFVFSALFSVSMAYNNKQDDCVVSASAYLFKYNDQNVSICVKSDDTVDITMTGDIYGWFGVGFNATVMNNAYAIVASTDSTTGTNEVLEYVLAASSCTSPLPTQMLTVVSDTSPSTIRTVVVNRARVGVNDNHYTFPNTPGSVPIIASYGGCTVLSFSCPMFGQYTGKLNFQ